MDIRLSDLSGLFKKSNEVRNPHSRCSQFQQAFMKPVITIGMGFAGILVVKNCWDNFTAALRGESISDDRRGNGGRGGRPFNNNFGRNGH